MLVTYDQRLNFAGCGRNCLALPMPSTQFVAAKDHGSPFVFAEPWLPGNFKRLDTVVGPLESGEYAREADERPPLDQRSPLIRMEVG